MTGAGSATIFVLLDPSTAKSLNPHAARPATRSEALEPLRKAARERWSGQGVAEGMGLCLGHQHGGPFVSDVFPSEPRFLGMDPSLPFVGKPEENGCTQRFL